MKDFLQIVKDNADRVKALGNWPEWVSIDSLISRIPPKDNSEKAPGFDAGIACALDLIPRDKQRLSATLHAAYTPEAVKQVRREIDLTNDEFENTETCWWLAACNACDDDGSIYPDGVIYTDFIDQINDFHYAVDSSLLVFDARVEWNRMQNSFTVVDDIAVALRDGGMQAAYVSGHELAIQAMHGIWFIGTFRPSLGIPDDFQWGTDKDEQGRPKSGPVHGSKQFVKAATFDEALTVLSYARHTLLEVKDD